MIASGFKLRTWKNREQLRSLDEMREGLLAKEAKGHKNKLCI